MDGQMDGQRDGWGDRRMDKQMDIYSLNTIHSVHTQYTYTM